jgi:hypothetical protein
MAIRDPALLHSTICSAGGHLALLEGTFGPENSEYLTHKTETIRIVNGRMTDLSQATTDETLGAIALLVTDQVVDGDYREMAVHMQGLAKLVNLRGGLPALGMKGLLAGEIQWLVKTNDYLTKTKLTTLTTRCDIATSFMTSSPPLLPLNETQGGPNEQLSSPLLQHFLSSDLPAQALPAALQENSLSDLLSEELVGIYWDMSTLTAILNLKPDLLETDMLVYDRKRASIQYRLASMHFPRSSVTEAESEAQSESKVYVQESCRMAGVLYSNMTLWGFQPPMHFYGDLAIMLQQALLRTDLEMYWGGGVWEDILLWILVLGGYAALNRPERVWFVELLAKIGMERRFWGFEDVRAVLVRVLYQEGLEKSFEKLWKEVGESMTRCLRGIDLHP